MCLITGFVGLELEETSRLEIQVLESSEYGQYLLYPKDNTYGQDTVKLFPIT